MDISWTHSVALLLYTGVALCDIIKMLYFSHHIHFLMVITTTVVTVSVANCNCYIYIYIALQIPYNLCCGNLVGCSPACGG
jgi:hypothetical protein